MNAPLDAGSAGIFARSERKSANRQRAHTFNPPRNVSYTSAPAARLAGKDARAPGNRLRLLRAIISRCQCEETGTGCVSGFGRGVLVGATRSFSACSKT